MEDRCLICGSIVPEGTEVCPLCLKKWLSEDDETKMSRCIEKKSEQKEKRGDEQVVIH